MEFLTRVVSVSKNKCKRLSCMWCCVAVALHVRFVFVKSLVTLAKRAWRVTRKRWKEIRKVLWERVTSRQVGQVVVDPGRTECTVRGATEPGVMPGGGSKKEKLWHGNLEGQILLCQWPWFMRELDCRMCEMRNLCSLEIYDVSSWTPEVR